MTSQDELRDRIMEPIWQNTMLTTEGAKQIAQAIIDDLGLTVETFSGLAGLTIDEPKSRVVGKWEET